MTVLRASRVVTPDRVLSPGEVVIEDGLILEVRPTTHPPPAVTICPGFVDLQMNGIDDVDVATADLMAWSRLDELLASSGTTTWPPTLVSAPPEAYGAALARIEQASRRPFAGHPRIAGIHLEGPFLGAKTGATTRPTSGPSTGAGSMHGRRRCDWSHSHPSSSVRSMPSPPSPDAASSWAWGTPRPPPTRPPPPPTPAPAS